MAWTLTHIYRHPVKALGAEALAHAVLEAGGGIPWDRAWAIVHAKADWNAAAPGYISGSRNVVNQAQVPRLVQLQIAFDDEQGSLNLSHPDLGNLSVTPADPADQTRLMHWIAPLTEGTSAPGPFQFCAAPGVRYTDFEETHLSIATGTSLRALEERVGQPLDHARFRMNLWLDGPAAWSDLEWVGQEIEIGEARFAVIARDKRCNATNANPANGRRDTQIPGVLQRDLGHMDFGVYAQVTRGGTIRCGDAARLV
ncbi:MAG: MOSC N-terminal beta barrel domain-containing protein [Pseudomonadota bacterium]